MKVLWLSHLVPFPAKAGVSLRSYHLIKQLSQRCELDLLAFNQRDLMAGFYDDIEQGLAEARADMGQFCNILDIISLPCDTMPHGNKLLALQSLLTKAPYNINWLKSRRFRAALKKALAENSYDVVHLDTISFTAHMDLLQGQCLSMDHHNIESHMLLRRADKESHKFKSWYFRQEGKRLQRYEQEYCPQMAMNITCSAEDSQRLKAIVPSAITEEIPNGVDIEFFKSSRVGEGDPKKLIFIGTLSWYPNAEAVEYIAEHWADLKQLQPELTVDIIGAHPPESIVEFSKTDPSFKVHGFVDDIRPFIDAAGIYLCPIMDGGGTKLKLLDAFAMSKAVLAHPIGCEGLAVTDEVNVLMADSDGSFISGIQRLIADSELRHSLELGARKLAEDHYGYDAIGEKLANTYQRL